MDEYGLYVIITKPRLPHTLIAEICVDSGVKMLQLREKDMSDRELVNIGLQIRDITLGTNTKFVINDRPDIALICKADYLHLGQDDIPIEQARDIVGDMKIGLSTHSIDQAREALAKNPDYIGFGPIFPTNAKANPDPPVGTEALKEVLTFSDIPVVAIGGIFPENIESVLDTGAKNIAMVRNLMTTLELDARIKEMHEKIVRSNPEIK